MGLAQERSVNRAVAKGGQTGQVASHLYDGDFFGIDTQFFQGHLSGVIRCRAKPADGDSFSSQTFGRFNVGPNQELVGNEIDAAGNDSRIRSLKVGSDGEGTGGKDYLQLIG